MTDEQIAIAENAENWKRRLGRFTLSREMIDSRPDEVQRIMANVIVVRAEVLYHNDVIEYIALSPWFEKCGFGYHPPEYEFIISDEVVCRKLE